MFRNSARTAENIPSPTSPSLTTGQLEFARVLGDLLAKTWTANQERAPSQALPTSPTLAKRGKNPRRRKNS